MKTSIKQLAGAVILTTAFILSGCNKQPVNPTTKPQTIPENSKTLHCSPWEDVADCNAAVTDLNVVASCNSSTCEVVQAEINKNGNYVRDTLGNIMYYDPYSTVTIADQNYIWSYAVNWANSPSNKPTGYILSQITFSTQTTTVPGTTITINTFKFDVLYRKCGRSGGGS